MIPDEHGITYKDVVSSAEPHYRTSSAHCICGWSVQARALPGMIISLREQGQAHEAQFVPSPLLNLRTPTGRKVARERASQMLRQGQDLVRQGEALLAAATEAEQAYAENPGLTGAVKQP